MYNIITTENIVLIGAMLLFVAVMAGKAAYRFGAPALLFFWGRHAVRHQFHFVPFR